MSTDEVDEYLHGLEERTRGALERLRRSIIGVVPDAEQGLSYGVPAFRLGGTPIAGFAAARHHLSYLPHSGSVLGSLDPARLAGFGVSKGALRFDVDRPLPDSLVARLIAARRAEAGV